MTKIANISFNQSFFDNYITNIFGESFAHSSLSFEKSFEESKFFAHKLREFISSKNTEYAHLLETSDKKEDQELLKQRLQEARDALLYYGIPAKSFVNEYDITVPGIDSYGRFLYGCVRPYRNTREYQAALNANELKGFAYESETLLLKVQELKQLIIGKVQADLNAKILKKANNQAFKYAMSLGEIGVPDIQEINALVNANQGIYKGFKRINNQINDCPFETCPKEYVPIRMQELLHKYYGEWAEEIPEFIDDISTDDEKEDFLSAICEREAKFHIEFERIHPFEDGNGRTGRIILNQHLIKNGLAPILITPEMRSVYLKCIDNNDYKSLGELIYMLSSVTLNDMISYYRNSQGINPDDLNISEEDDRMLIK